MPVRSCFRLAETCRPDSRIGRRHRDWRRSGGIVRGSTATIRMAPPSSYSKQEDRPGGRVHSQRLAGGHVIDLGAQFMGDTQTYIAALADEAGLHRVSAVVPGHILHLSSEDAVPSRRPADQLPLSMIDRFDALQAFWRLERAMASLDGQNLARLDRIDAASFIRGKTFLRPAFQAIGGYLEGEICTPLRHVSAYEALEQGASIGGFAGEGASAQWFLAAGAATMTQFLAEAIEGSLVLNAPVSRVMQNSDAVTVTAATDTYRAARAIVAVPPQLYGTLGMVPELPRSWQDALRGWRPGSVVKTILVFREPWWRRSGLAGTIVSLGGTFGAAVDASPQDGAGILVVFFHRQGGASVRAKTRREGPHSRGDAVAVPCPWHTSSRPARCPALLDWSAEPFSVGGYASRRGIGGWTAAPDLFSPHGRLHFAETETATRWRSFMDGAVQSGIRSANEVLGGQQHETGDATR